MNINNLNINSTGIDGLYVIKDSNKLLVDRNTVNGGCNINNKEIIEHLCNLTYNDIEVDSIVRNGIKYTYLRIDVNEGKGEGHTELYLVVDNNIYLVNEGCSRVISDKTTIDLNEFIKKLEEVCKHATTLYDKLDILELLGAIVVSYDDKNLYMGCESIFGVNLTYLSNLVIKYNDTTYKVSNISEYIIELYLGIDKENYNIKYYLAIGGDKFTFLKNCGIRKVDYIDSRLTNSGIRHKVLISLEDNCLYLHTLNDNTLLDISKIENLSIYENKDEIILDNIDVQYVKLMDNVNLRVSLNESSGIHHYLDKGLENIKLSNTTKTSLFDDLYLADDKNTILNTDLCSISQEEVHNVTTEYLSNLVGLHVYDIDKGADFYSLGNILMQDYSGNKIKIWSLVHMNLNNMQGIRYQMGVMSLMYKVLECDGKYYIYSPGNYSKNKCIDIVNSLDLCIEDIVNFFRSLGLNVVYDNDKCIYYFICTVFYNYVNNVHNYVATILAYNSKGTFIREYCLCNIDGSNLSNLQEGRYIQYIDAITKETVYVDKITMCIK